MNNIRIGDVWLVNLREDESVQGGIRPCIVKSNDKNNIYSPNVNVIPVTTQHKKYIPTHITIYPTTQNGLAEKSIALCEGVIPIPKSRLIKKLGCVNELVLQKLDVGCSIQLDIKDVFNLELAQGFLNNIQITANSVNNATDDVEYYMAAGMLKAYIKNLREYCERFNINYMKYLNKINLKENKLLGVI